MGQLIVSILCVISFMYVCKRKDDGWLTRIISYLGWFLIMSSRVLLFCLIMFYIHQWLILFCVLHVVCMSIWVYNIAIESYAISSSSASATTEQFRSLRKRGSLAILVLFFFGIPRYKKFYLKNLKIIINRFNPFSISFQFTFLAHYVST